MKTITKIAIAGLAAIISSCAAPEIKPRPFEYKIAPGVTRTDYFDGSYTLVSEEPSIEFRHNKPGNYDYARIKNPEINISITDNGCDGISEMVVIQNELGMDDLYFRFQPGKEWLFEKADKMLSEAKKALEIQ
ncbi:MAG: hypothetical protein KJ955_04905 [Nanoarchaeota archaeon]|nr:hypothetical protein [Nanoarchaeota archaeon]